MNRLTIEIRPFGNYCNKTCRYCYQNRSEKSFVSKDHINSLISKVNYYTQNNDLDSLKIIFHGGEPLWDNGRYIKAITNQFKRYLKFKKVAFGIHTNGLTLNKSLINISDETHVCVSIDQPNDRAVLDNKYYQDIINLQHSITPNRLIYQIVLYKQFSVERLFVLEQLLDSLKALNIKLIYYLTSDELREEFRTSIKKYLQLLYSDGYSVEPIKQIFSEKELKGCQFNESGCLYKSKNDFSICLDVDGSIYACNRFAAINTDRITKIDNTMKSEEFWTKIFSLQIYGCKYSKLCQLNVKSKCKSGGCKFEQTQITKLRPYQCTALEEIICEKNFSH